MGQRKQRSDKKREVKPYLSLDLKDMVYRLSYITSTPVKDVCEFMCVKVISEKKSIDRIAMFFKRDIRLDMVTYRGSMETPAINKRGNGTKERVTVRFKQEDFDLISILSYALDCTASRAVSFILETALRDMEIVNAYVKMYLNEQLTPDQMKDLRNLLRNMNSYVDDNHSWLSLMLVVMDEVSTPIKRTKEAIGEFLVKINRYDEE